MARVYINLIDQKEPTFDLSITGEGNLMSNNRNIQYFKKIIKPSEEEIKQHKLYLNKNLKKNFF